MSRYTVGVWIRLGLRVVARVSASVPSPGTPASRLQGNRSEADAWSMSEVPPCPTALCRWRPQGGVALARGRPYRQGSRKKGRGANQGGGAMHL
jgi:hypothetical protein